jgi:hypothetical protein
MPKQTRARVAYCVDSVVVPRVSSGELPRIFALNSIVGAQFVCPE